MNDYGVLQECDECRTICFPQTYLKTVICESCPISVLESQQAYDRESKVFLLRDGELKCEECWLQTIFAEKVARAKESA